jgi:hypothetical protein
LRYFAVTSSATGSLQVGLDRSVDELRHLWIGEAGELCLLIGRCDWGNRPKFLRKRVGYFFAESWGLRLRRH